MPYQGCLMEIAGDMSQGPEAYWGSQSSPARTPEPCCHLHYQGWEDV